jgi:hypothetical protein
MCKKSTCFQIKPKLLQLFLKKIFTQTSEPTALAGGEKQQSDTESNRKRREFHGKSVKRRRPPLSCIIKG